VKRREFIAALGGAAAWPVAARAEQTAMPVIGFLSPGSPEADTSRMNAVRRGLAELGYVEGENVTIKYRGAQNQYDRLPALAADLVSRQVTVIAAAAIQATLAAKAATNTIPIVFGIGSDPVQLGLVTSLNRPGGNITGVTVPGNLNAAVTGKRLELLHELAPATGVIALLTNPSTPVTEVETKALHEAARALGVELRVLNVVNASEIDTAFATTLAKEHPVPAVVSNDPFFTNQRVRLVVLAARHAIPAMYAYREFTAAGGLMSYGIDLADAYRQVGTYAGKILKGAKPSDLPVQQSLKVELVINLNTAKAIGLTVPPSLLARADEVIE
jgi:putative tryptophan/tyrosine transport system substrate-binding protein